MIYVTSDIHGWHSNLCEGTTTWAGGRGTRKFNTPDEMTMAAVNSINDVVLHDDTLYHLGDWAFGGHQNVPRLRSLIKCKDVRIILGNHDHNIHKYSDLFTWIRHYHELRHKGILFCLFHYSMRIWNQSHHGAIHLYGHSHGTLPGVGRSMDVGWDIEQRPFSLNEIIQRFKDVKPALIDHHNSETS